MNPHNESAVHCTPSPGEKKYCRLIDAITFRAHEMSKSLHSGELDRPFTWRNTVPLFTPPQRSYVNSRPAPQHPHHVHPPAADLLSRPRPAPYPPSGRLPLLPRSPARAPSPTDSYGPRRGVPGRYGFGEFEIPPCKGPRLWAAARRPRLPGNGAEAQLPPREDRSPPPRVPIGCWLHTAIPIGWCDTGRRDGPARGLSHWSAAEAGLRPARTVGAPSPAPKADRKDANLPEEGPPSLDGVLFVVQKVIERTVTTMPRSRWPRVSPI
nr:protein transport protein SEC31-like [Peromyscus maniculatus bairdii]